MAKVIVKFDNQAFALNVRQTFAKVKKSKQLNTQIGKFVADRLRGEAKRGKPLNATRSFPKLSDVTVAIRKSLAKLNPTGSPFRASFSNTTLSGQILGSIKSTAKKDFVVVGVTGKRKPLTINKKGDKEKLQRGVNATNKDLAKTLAKLGFVIFDAKTVARNDKIKKRIKSLTLKFLRRALRASKLRS